VANYALLGSKTYQIVFIGGAWVNITTSSGLSEADGYASDDLAATKTGRIFYQSMVETLTSLGLQISESNICYVRDITSDTSLTPNPIQTENAMTQYSPPWVEAARLGNLFDVTVKQAADFATANGDGFYHFNNAAAGELTYTVPSGRKAFLRRVTLGTGSATLFGTLAFYIGSTLHLKIAVPPGGCSLDLTPVCGLNGGYIPATSVIKMMFDPSLTNVDCHASFGGWLE